MRTAYITVTRVSVNMPRQTAHQRGVIQNNNAPTTPRAGASRSIIHRVWRRVVSDPVLGVPEP
eukprot:2181369-Pyramimonas_sp.AAC.1